jgi:ribosomal-protein-alanine N-acetyltransferase
MTAIRPATPNDLQAIAIMQGRSSWQPAAYLEHRCNVAVVDGHVAGFLVTRESAPREREILNLVVDAAYRRQGIARALLRDEIQSFQGVWFLEVRESNAPAIGLYKTSGFEPVGRRSEYYSDPGEAGIVMRFFS